MSLISFVFLYTVYAILGGVLGVIQCFVLCSSKTKGIAKATSVPGIFTGIFGSWNYINEALIVTVNHKTSTLLVFLILYIFSTIVTFIILAKKLSESNKSENRPFKLDILKIFLHGQAAIELDLKYDNNRIDIKAEQEKFDLKVEKLNAQKKEIDQKEIDLLNKEKEIEKQIYDYNKLLKKELLIKLPINYDIPIDSDFLSKTTMFYENYAVFCQALTLTTYTCIKKKQVYDSQAAKDILNSYFSTICHAINNLLVIGDANDIRIHVRILKNDEYITYMYTNGKNIINDQLTVIPKGKLICRAFDNRKSLIRSANKEYHHKGTNDKLWEDHITIPINITGKNDCHFERFMSFGVSINAFQ